MTRSSSAGRAPKLRRSCNPNSSATWKLPYSGWVPGSFPARPRRRWKRRSTHRRHESWRPYSAPSTTATPAKRRRRAVGDFVIRIPRVSVAVSEAELTELLVRDGEHVEDCSLNVTTATEKAEQEVEAGASGTVRWTGEVGATYDIGVEI